ncbi:hypothetical protein [Geodermatophilus sp. SYSU D01105]
MTASDPQPGQPGPTGDGPKSSDLRRWLKWVVLALVALVVVLTLTVSLSRCGSDDGPSGGPENAMGTSVADTRPALSS